MGWDSSQFQPTAFSFGSARGGRLVLQIVARLPSGLVKSFRSKIWQSEKWFTWKLSRREEKKKVGRVGDENFFAPLKKFAFARAVVKALWKRS